MLKGYFSLIQPFQNYKYFLLFSRSPLVIGSGIGKKTKFLQKMDDEVRRDPRPPDHSSVPISAAVPFPSEVSGLARRRRPR